MHCEKCGYRKSSFDTECPNCLRIQQTQAVQQLQQQVQMQRTQQPFSYQPHSLQMPIDPRHQNVKIIQMPPGQHSFAAAILLALFFPGAGQLVNQQRTKGLWLLLGPIGFYVLCGLLMIPTGGISLIPLAIMACLGHPILYIIALIDAIIIGGKLQRGQPVRVNEWF